MTSARRISLSLACSLTLSLAVAPAALAVEVHDGVTADGFTSYVSADITSPAPNAVFHTGGPSNSININYYSDHVAKVTSDGTNSVDTTFGFENKIFLDTNS